MNKILFVSFKKQNQAGDAEWVLRDLHATRAITLYADAIIAKDPSGRIVVQHSDVDHPFSTLGGPLLMNLLSLLGPAAVAVDSGSGVLIGAAINAAMAGITTDFIQVVENELASGKTALIAEIDEEWENPLDVRMEALGGTVFRQTRVQLEDALFERDIEAQEAELANLEKEQEAGATAEEKRSSAERNARLQAKIDAMSRKMEKKRNELAERIQSVTDEAEGKMSLIQGQMTTADDTAKSELDRRLKDIQADYQSRTKKLSETLARVKKAHAA
jgi:uncharacterized membrane protein